MRKVVFIEDFAGKSKGDEFKCDSMLASQLVHVDMVAKYADVDELELEEKPKRAKTTKK